MTLKYYLPTRGKAACTFIGPFEIGKVVRCQEGLDCTLTPTGAMWADGRGTKFHISASNIPVADETYDRVLAYDVRGKQYLVRSQGGRTRGSGTLSSAEKDYVIEGVVLTRIAAITIGEEPQKKTFRNIRLRYPDRPTRDYPEYLDKMASALDLNGISAEQLQEYYFKSADEALKVIEIVRGPHIDRAWQAIDRSDFAALPQAESDKLHRTAKMWSDNGYFHGIKMGLKGQWPEFVAPALAVLGQDIRGRSEVAHSLQAYRLLTPQELGQIVAILEQRDDPRGMYSLLSCLKLNRRRPGGQEALLSLARSNKVWLWWPALEYLTASNGLTLGQLTRDLQVKYLAKSSPELGLDPVLAAEARALLAKLPTAKLAVVSPSTLREVLRSVATNLDRPEAQAALLDLLQDKVNHWGDYQFEGYSPSAWWAIDRAVRYLNNWNDLNLGGIGSDVTEETSEYGRIDWPALAKKVLVHFRRAPARQIEAAVPAKTRPYTITLTDALDQPIPDATLNLQAAGIQRSRLRPKLFPEGPHIRVQTDAKGRFKIDWPIQAREQRVYSFTGQASHPEYGIAPLTVHPGKEVRALLVKKGSPQYERALKGQVMNEAGQPMAGAVVESNRALTPRMSGKGSAMTDSNGHFVMHLLPYSEKDKKRLLPADTKYAVVARASMGMDLFPVRADGQSPMRLVLRTPTLRPRRLQFETGENQYAQGDELDCIRMTWTPPETRTGSIVLECRYVSDSPVRLIPGRYLARYNDGHRRLFEYLPVEIDQSSPETITFRRPPAVTYHGQVVDGITGEPVAGAFVFTYGGGTGSTNLAMLFEQDWRNLEAMPDHPSLVDDPGVKALRRHYRVEAIVRTDVQGRYEITRGLEQGATSLIVLAKDRLPTRMRLSKLKADGQQRAQVPAIAMFPAAYVKLYPKVPVGARVSVYPQWEYQAEGQPEWFQRFQEAMKEAGFPPWLDVSGPVRVFVPAGVRLKLRFRANRNSSCVAEPDEQVLDLSPGETKDLGELKFVPARKPTPATNRNPPASQPATPPAARPTVQSGT